MTNSTLQTERSSKSDPLQQAASKRPTPPPSPSIENCDALIFSLASRRIVIVRRDGPIRIWSAQQLCRPIRELTLGEAVFYNGHRDTVRAMSIY